MKQCEYAKCGKDFTPLTTWQRFCCDGCRTRHNQQKPRVQKAEHKPRESSIEAYLVRRVKALGGEVRKVSWIGRRGAPDRLVMLPVFVLRGGRYAHNREPQTIWIELKAPGKKPEPHQLREHERMRAMGQRVEVIDSFEGVDSLLGVK